MTVYAYIRVSSVDQNEARQVKTMKDKGVLKERMHIDKVSGKNTDRPQYQLLKEAVQDGDTIINVASGAVLFAITEVFIVIL